MKKSSIIKLAVVGTVGACVGKVVSTAVNSIVPDNAGKLTKMAFKVGGIGITIAATKAISDKIDESVDDVIKTIDESKKAIKEANKELEKEEELEEEIADIDPETITPEDIEEMHKEVCELGFEKENAEKMLKKIKDNIDDYGQASVGTVMRAIGHMAEPKQFIYGWKSHDDIKVVSDSVDPEVWHVHYPELEFLM